MALFGEKYGDQVRVVEVGEYARELCGGTHVSRSGQLGLVKILHEASIGSGVRRVEALVGLDAFAFLAREHVLVSRLAELYRVRPEEVADRVEQTVAALRDAEKELEKLRAQLVLGNAGALADAARDIGGVALVGVEAPEGTSGNDVRTLAQEIRGRAGAARPAVVAVASRAGGKASLVVAVNAGRAGARARRAGDLVKGALSGRGGGNADLAQGGGVPADAGAGAARRGRDGSLHAAAESGAPPALGRAVPWRPGVRLGVDVGKVGVGVAISDPDGILATPVATLRRDLDAAGDGLPDDIAELVRLVEDYESVEVVVGLPREPGRRRGPAAEQVRAYVRRLAGAVAPVPYGWPTRGCRPSSQHVGCPSAASGVGATARSSTRPRRWRSCRDGSMQRGGRRDDRRSGPGLGGGPARTTGAADRRAGRRASAAARRRSAAGSSFVRPVHVAGPAGRAGRRRVLAASARSRTTSVPPDFTATRHRRGQRDRQRRSTTASATSPSALQQEGRQEHQGVRPGGQAEPKSKNIQPGVYKLWEACRPAPR